MKELFPCVPFGTLNVYHGQANWKKRGFILKKCSDMQIIWVCILSSSDLKVSTWEISAGVYTPGLNSAAYNLDKQLNDSRNKNVNYVVYESYSISAGTTNLSLVDVPEPHIAAPDEVKIKIWQVGICGTDHEQAEGGRADAPEGKTQLIIGHEMFGEVVEIGSEVKRVQKGDSGVFIVRRGCGKCKACMNGRSDMCFTGDYTERGIKGADGFQAEYVVDKEQYLVKVPEEMKEIGVLTEPMSVASKAIDEAMIIQQARLSDFDESLNWLKGKRALVAGIGPIGLMAAFALRLRGAEVIGMDIVDKNSSRPAILERIGGKYVDGRKINTLHFDEECGDADFVFEATGIAKLQIELIDTLARNGIYVPRARPCTRRRGPGPAACGAGPASPRAAADRRGPPDGGTSRCPRRADTRARLAWRNRAAGPWTPAPAPPSSGPPASSADRENVPERTPR